MADRLARALRLFRRVPVVGAVAGGERRDCGASGWHVRAGCGDGAGGTICPLCSRRVRTVSDATIARGIAVIKAHSA